MNALSIGSFLITAACYFVFRQTGLIWTQLLGLVSGAVVLACVAASVRGALIQQHMPRTGYEHDAWDPAVRIYNKNGEVVFVWIVSAVLFAILAYMFLPGSIEMLLGWIRHFLSMRAEI